MPEPLPEPHITPEERLHRLHAALLEAAPAAAVYIAATKITGPGLPARCVQVTYRFVGPLQLIWNEDRKTYLWHDGPRRGIALGDDSVKAAEQAAAHIGIPLQEG